MESMTNAPHLTFVRKGVRYGQAPLYDHMALDGLEDAYERGRAMGVFAEECVDKYKFSREAMDQFAIASTQRSKKANEDGSFAWEIAPGDRARQGRRHGDQVRRAAVQGQARQDPGPEARVQEGRHDHRRHLVEHLRRRRALVLMRESTASRLGSKPVARIVAHSVHAQAPNLFTTAPVGAIEKVLKKAGWKAADVDLWEVNEAFAAVTMAAMTEFKLPHEIVNVHGGAVALGHPIGASGARIVVTLLGALRKAGKKKGIAALCIGGGEATAMAVELL
jgi:acetyl-CoA C-acetyltransferase